jgi:hypothetical protein
MISLTLLNFYKYNMTQHMMCISYRINILWHVLKTRTAGKWVQNYKNTSVVIQNCPEILVVRVCCKPLIFSKKKLVLYIFIIESPQI